MGEVLGMLASGGMLLLIGCLIVAFLVEIDVVTREDGRRLLRVILFVLAIGSLHLLLGALTFQMTRGGLGSAADYQAIFHSPSMKRVYALLETPSFAGPLTGVFVYCGHFLGKLFGQSASGGLVLAWSITSVAVAIVFFRARSLWNERAAWNLVFVILCLPFAVFFYLPGWASLALLLAASAFVCFGKRLPSFSFPWLAGKLWIVCVVLSLTGAFVTAALALGRLG